MNNIKVFTVSSLDGIEVKEYIKPVTYHVVIGMNFFADFLQSFTDFFGGQSSTYQKKLKEINESVIEGIKNEVKKVGGNCAIGLKIENDEISAKGKSMIMVSAFATAVIIKEKKESTISNSNEYDNLEIDAEKYEVSKNLNVIKRKLESYDNPLEMPESWMFFIKNNLTSQFDYLMNFIFEYENNSNSYKPMIYRSHLIEYFSIFNKNDITEKYYSYLETKDNLNEYIVLRNYLNLLNDKKLHFINNTSKNLDLLSSNDTLLFDCGFCLAVKELESYNKKDIENYKRIIALFNDKYPVISTYDDLELTCSKCNDKRSRGKRCKRCKSDSRGIDRDSILFDEQNTGDDLIEILENRIKYIQQAFEI